MASPDAAEVTTTERRPPSTVRKLRFAATARADFERAGFVVVGTSDMLANPADAHDLNVFDEKIRGKTDRFILKLKKPAK